MIFINAIGIFLLLIFSFNRNDKGDWILNLPVFIGLICTQVAFFGK